ncbi:GTPase ObgE [Haploplasma axanthum]|uniref:GTPase Obg n=1 Tax=Haploplasma axanthum TaxID=29552 RepID=A0A449BEA0_HAPAX|nr:GTPase ObgE [Haploplasma axanthum]VEU80752.1 GTPase obg [Haploplasma axanthum]
MFIDEVVVEVYGGRGGHGMTSFRREKYVEYGGPSGGNGGNGGNVIFVGDEGKLTLVDFRYQRHIKAQNGENGKSKGMHGANASSTYIKVPLGTIVYDTETGRKIGEITYNKQELIVAKGGRGGRGNMAFATNKNPAPRVSENGDKGETLKIKIDLKVLADVGLLGFPSVGKSTIISVVSNARPKIADYPFTTLAPNLGMVNYKNKDFVLADLPGLIENAADGLGLGIKFLKHIERCRIFLHVIDLTNEDPYLSFEIINNELKKYNEELLKRKQIVVLNKSDAVDQEKINDTLKKFSNYDTLLISAYTKEGINELLDRVIYELENIPPLIVDEDKTHEVYELETKDNDVDIYRENGMFYVIGSQVELFFNRTNFGEEESIKRFARQLRTLGVEDKLRQLGAKTGDTINVYGYEFDYLGD